MADDKTNGSVQNIENTPDIYHQVAEEEQQRMILGEKKTTPTETVAFKACIPCQRDNNANQRQRRGDAIEQCTHCGRNGHDWDRCFKKIGCPNRRSINAKRDEGKPKATHVGTYTSPVPANDLQWRGTSGIKGWDMPLKISLLQLISSKG
ncbi:hypothetical protein HanXRQr2_Chr11g0511931 [Helianthus annuus]|uniref:Uncharacterized protein n=1 Tax=Helianthus annuus TaxID=4232 RepID=A0A251TCV6_HELAN|nr:hypothetical protein HanXRQr2_Chr11g0511931 [Helianthus annuus]